MKYEERSTAHELGMPCVHVVHIAYNFVRVLSVASIFSYKYTVALLKPLQLYKNEKKKSKKEKSSAKRGSRTASPETNAATLQDSTKPGEDSSGRTDQEGIGEGEEDEDDIVVFAESETGGTGDDDDDETQRDTGEKVGERKAV